MIKLVASNTVYITINVYGCAKEVNIYSSHTRFSGRLVIAI